ncbi:SDR family oxidoreductase [Solirubrobacter ginsenosidimutans]|uniref:SDR family oxidoreductase n=1 Tax=Solirubrobacter ginsenosidimutans TaxID=490573 RepID=A0A9X3N0C1_9ACTN|nr:SDR family oxidoreductase [Solirubrobacter ginsenosidimutans]MDA0164675.1 SDR family oxidoreductase [Solirubrobacter ginsenosidimutans]
MNLQDRRAVVTGASSGIGAATARALAAAGAHVTLIARRADRIEALADELGGTAVAADVGDRAALEAAASDADLVVANAGVMLPSPAEESAADDLDRMLNANLIGLVNTTRAFAPSLLAAAERGGPADLVVVSSIAAHIAFPNYAGYAATKAGATQFAAGVRAEWAGRGVRVTIVEPGGTQSELADHVRPGLQEELNAMFAEIELLTSEDVANVITFITSQPTHVNLSRVELVPTMQA